MTLYPIRGVFFMRKKKSIIGISVVAALFMALAGCGKANDEVAQEPINNIDDNEVVQPVQEPVAEPKQVSFSDVWGDKIPSVQVKNAPVSGLKANLQYLGSENIYAQNFTSDELTEILNLERTLFTAVHTKNNAANNAFLATDGVRLNGRAGDASGNQITVSIADGCTITSIYVVYNSASYAECAVVSNGTETVTGVDGVYAINSSSFSIISDNTGKASNTQVRFKSIEITYEGPAASDVAAALSTRSSLTYYYSKSDLDETDTLNKENTYGASGTDYKDWTKDDAESGVIYSANSGGRNSSIQLKSTDHSGIIVVSNQNKCRAVSVTITWDTHTTEGYQLDVYGKDTKYSDTSDLYNSNKGTIVHEFVYSSSLANNQETYVLGTQYKYLGFRSNKNTMYINSISIQWEGYSYTFSNTAIRFGGLIRKSLWDRLETESDIQGYGVRLSTEEYLGGADLKDSVVDGTNVKDFFNNSKEHPDLAEAEQKAPLKEDCYIWNLYKKISVENLKLSYVAAAYIKVAGETIFLNEATFSIKSIANSYITGGQYTSDFAEGSLNILANLD